MITTLTRTFLMHAAIVGALACEAGAQSPSVQFIPEAKQLSVTQDAFHLNRDIRVILADARCEDDRFGAHDFMDDVKATAGLTLTIGKGRSRHDVLIGGVDLPQVQQAL